MVCVITLGSISFLSEDPYIRFFSAFYSTMLIAIFIAFSLDIFQNKKDTILKYRRKKVKSKSKKFKEI